ncbi:ATP synthase F1 subunit delta [Tenacibaculum piscium]|uniref:ATP synthase subunit delta n=1 Tax=Tenacibaculum piscium TaxID=1458515 RepID=A0A2H1YKG7_9FLAO|nr:ATP synthase F1 subunit delta [Tenacibaculum piscium]MBE7629236.1 ATP synthase F1 subunit delta [Tenacibaculum piscium]MBE7670023.1 ATP synthase F1 subunit delta [Tenacibaculum piscium]MBE7685552.1 ATP synthase F1 subunit delta [Tenacibaculum piscium]MBE7690136.1 ATP synthase F1 subunit delta [Tenacibaculum piscium]SOS75973.1 ATP synthase subunit delta [Tenacibaculum piscium]
MKGARPALRYAKAILNLAKQTNKDSLVNDNMKLIADTIEESEDLKRMLNSPIVKTEDKKKVLIALFGDKVDKVIKGLFNVLEQNKRMTMLASIATQYSLIYNQYKGIQLAKVTTAVALTKELEDKIQAKIVSLTGNSASIENIVNPSIIGGFILCVGDVQYDASISNQFNKLRREFDTSHNTSQI